MNYWKPPLTYEMKGDSYMVPIQTWTYPPGWGYPPAWTYPPAIISGSTTVSFISRPDYRRRRRASYCHGGRR